MSEGRPPSGADHRSGGEAAAQDTPAPCRECGAPLAAGQPYCLECGAPTPVAPAITRGGRAAGWVAAGLIVAGIGAGALTWAVAAGDDDPGPVIAVTTATDAATDVPATTDATTAEALPTDTAATAVPGTDTAAGTLPIDPSVTATDTTATDPPISTATPPPATDPQTTADWPAGRIGWTAVVSSGRDRSEAIGTKASVRAAGEPAGVLFSSDFATLKPGFYVVFSGVFSRRDAAAAHSRELAGRFPGAYPRRIAA